MAGQDLKTASLFEEAEKSRAAAAREAAAAQLAAPPKVRAMSGWEKANSWISVVAAGAVFVCLAVFAVGYITSPRTGKRTNALDLWLRLGGASSDQTFEKFIRDTATNNQFDWEEMYRKSPAYQFKDVQFDAQSLNWQFNSQRKK